MKLAFCFFDGNKNIINDLFSRMQYIKSEKISLFLLPSEYCIGEKMMEDIVEDNFEKIIILGQSKERSGLSFERFALNYTSTTKKDMSMSCNPNEIIMFGGRAAYSFHEEVNQMNIISKDIDVSARISNNPGDYLCNHLFYYGNAFSEKIKTKTKVMLIHIGTKNEKAIHTNKVERFIEELVNIFS